MEEKPRSPFSNGLSYGLMTGGAMIVFSLVLFLLDQHMNKTVSWLGYLIMVAGMIWGTIEYRKRYSGGFLTYGQAFSSCFWIGVFAGVLSTVYFFVFINYIHPGFVNELMDQMRANMAESQPELDEEQVERAIEISSKFMSPVMMTIWGLVTYIASSAVIGLIVAIFLKKEDPSLKANM